MVRPEKRTGSVAVSPPESKKFSGKRPGSILKSPSDDLSSAAPKKKIKFSSADSVSAGPAEGLKNVDRENRKSSFRTSKNVQQKLSVLSRKERKSYIRKLKEAKKPASYNTSLKAKLIWEKLRNTKLDKSDKEKLVQELYGLVNGKVKELIYAHDTVRVFQCLMALKNEQIRTKLFEELKDDVLNMSKQKYAKYFVVKMLKYGTPSQRSSVIKSFYGHVPELMKNAIASDVVEYAYNEFANALQRSHIASEFYAADYRLFKGDKPMSLKEFLEAEPQKKDIVFKTLLQHLTDMTNKPVMRHSLTHHLLMEFFENFPKENHSDLIESLKDNVVEMVHTKRGVLTAMRCIWFGSVKTRKSILKTLKGLVTKICLEEHGHLFLLSIFDTVDDTALVGKIVLQEISKNLKEIMPNKYGVKVLQYLLSPRDSRHFNKQIIDCLTVGDKETISKKPRNVKYAELLATISPALVQYASENAREMLFDPHSCLLFGLICEKATGDKRFLFQCLCNVLTDEFIPCNSDNFHAVEHPNSNFVLKHLIRGDRLLHSNELITFSQVLLEQVDESHISSWLSCNRGAFLVLDLLETKIPVVREKILPIVEKSKKRLKKYTFPAAKLLLKLCDES